MPKHFHLAGAFVLGMLAVPASAQTAADSSAVRPEHVRAHASFLASEALQGRGSATRDEAIAAAYVASQFEGFGLKTAPGMTGYLQPANIVQLRLGGAAQMTVNGAPLAAPTVLVGAAQGVTGKLALFSGADVKAMPAGDIILAASQGIPVMQLYRAAAANKAKLVILRESDETRAVLQSMGGTPRMPSFLEGETPPPRTAVVTLPPADFDRLASTPGAEVALTLPVVRTIAVTTNAIGWLPGSDAKAGVILLSAHLDHLGPKPGGVVMYGANDDASGTTAVLELARALAAARQTKRGILFVAYGAEEIGGFGSTYFGEHPPVPLTDIVANIEIDDRRAGSEASRGDDDDDRL